MLQFHEQLLRVVQKLISRKHWYTFSCCTFSSFLLQCTRQCFMDRVAFLLISNTYVPIALRDMNSCFKGKSCFWCQWIDSIHTPLLCLRRVSTCRRRNKVYIHHYTFCDTKIMQTIHKLQSCNINQDSNSSYLSLVDKLCDWRMSWLFSNPDITKQPDKTKYTIAPLANDATPNDL